MRRRPAVKSAMCDCLVLLLLFVSSELNLGIQASGFTVVKSCRPTEELKHFLTVRVLSSIRFSMQLQWRRRQDLVPRGGGHKTRRPKDERNLLPNLSHENDTKYVHVGYGVGSFPRSKVGGMFQSE